MEAAAAEEQEQEPQPQPQPVPQPQPQAVPQAVARAESDASSSREMPSNPGGGALLSELRARRRSQQHGSPVAAERRLQEQIREQKQRDKRDAEARHARQRADATAAKAERWAHAAADSGSSVVIRTIIAGIWVAFFQNCQQQSLRHLGCTLPESASNDRADRGL